MQGSFWAEQLGDFVSIVSFLQCLKLNYHTVVLSRDDNGGQWRNQPKIIFRNKLVRHKQAWTHIFRTTQRVINKFLKIIKKLLMPHSLTAMCVSQQLQCCFFGGNACKIPFTILNTCMYMYALFSYSLWFFMVAIASQYGCHQRSRSGFLHHIRLPASCNIAPQHITMFPDSVITA